MGFIAEDVPELVARPGRTTLSALEIVAVLTKVVQEQQRVATEHARLLEEKQKVVHEQRKVVERQQQAIAELTARVRALEPRP